jgi:hypothetical protein
LTASTLAAWLMLVDRQTSLDIGFNAVDSYFHLKKLHKRLFIKKKIDEFPLTGKKI